MRELQVSIIGQGQIAASNKAVSTSLPPGKLYKIISTHSWSPIVFAGDVRRQENYRQCEVIALDIDGGLTITQAKKALQPFNHIIATTKSHQKDKHGVVCDRFRVLLFLDKPITDLATYKATWMAANQLLGKAADPGTFDGARFYYPSTPVTSQSGGQFFKAATPSTVPKYTLPDDLYGVVKQYITGQANNRTQLTCPFHADDRASAVIYHDRLNFYCSGCGVSYTRAQMYQALGLATSNETTNYGKQHIDEYFGSLTTILKEDRIMPKWIIQNYIPDSGIVMIGADSGAGKTWICQDLLLSLTSHKPNRWLNAFDAPNDMRAMYLAYEDSRENFHNRLCELSLGKGLSEQDWGHASIGFLPDKDMLTTDVGLSALISVIKRDGIQVLFIDTFRDAASGIEENDSQQSNDFIKRLRKITTDTSCLIITTHHIRKQTEMRASKSSVRGSTAIVGSIDTLLTVNSDQIGPCEKNVCISVEKQRIGPTGQSTTIKQRWLTGNDWLHNSVVWQQLSKTEQEEDEVETLSNKLISLTDFSREQARLKISSGKRDKIDAALQALVDKGTHEVKDGKYVRKEEKNK